MRVGIIGTGLIGASIGLAARALGDRVRGYDLHERAAQEALECGAIDDIVAKDDVYAQSDVVVIAAHIDGTIEEIERLRALPLREDLLVIDIASVKAPVAAAAQGNPHFVPTHPMAGSERHGAAAARDDLFAGRTWCYVPTADDRRTASARAFIGRLGARPVAVDAHEHDRIAALTSHLPQLFAFAFTECVAQSAGADPETVDALCGPVARELLRIGRSSPRMWDEIFTSNARAIDEARARVDAALDARRLSR